MSSHPAVTFVTAILLFSGRFFLVPVIADDDDEEDEGLADLKEDAASAEADMLQKIAHGDSINRDDDEEGNLQGELDKADEGKSSKSKVDPVDDNEPDAGDDDMEIYDEDEDGNFNVKLDSFVVQKLHKGAEDTVKPPSTTYHAFDDYLFKVPLFTRSADDFKVDFIIFSNPQYPAGTGHYVVLRRLASSIEIGDYELDDAVDDVFYHQYDDVEVYSTETGFEQLPDDPGQEQSAEEDYADNADITFPDKEGNNIGGGMPNEDEYVGLESKLEYKTNVKVGANQEESENPTETTEIVYEAFSIILKESLHGYLSDIDPLQYSFLIHEESSLAAILGDEVDTDADPPEEGDDDSDTSSEEIEPPEPEDIEDMQVDMDLEANMDSEPEWKDFQNQIKDDAGMQDKGGESDEETDAEEEAKKQLKMSGEDSEKSRKKRSTPDRKVIGKTLRLTPGRKVSKTSNGTVMWKKCLHPLDIHEIF